MRIAEALSRSCEVFFAMSRTFHPRLPSYSCRLFECRRPGLSTMKISYVAIVVGISFALAAPSPAQETSTARAVVTATTKGEDVTAIPRRSITVTANRKSQDVTGWVPLRGARSGLQLVVLLDDSSRGNLGLQFNDIRNFLTALPPNAQVAIGYMRNGSPNLLQNFTTDHAAAAKTLRLPQGSAGINGSPYFCLSALAKQWPGGDNNVRGK